MRNLIKYFVMCVVCVLAMVPTTTVVAQDQGTPAEMPAVAAETATPPTIKGAEWVRLLPEKAAATAPPATPEVAVADLRDLEVGKPAFVMSSILKEDYMGELWARVGGNPGYATQGFDPDAGRMPKLTSHEGGWLLSLRGTDFIRPKERATWPGPTKELLSPVERRKWVRISMIHDPAAPSGQQWGQRIRDNRRGVPLWSLSMGTTAHVPWRSVKMSSSGKGWLDATTLLREASFTDSENLHSVAVRWATSPPHAADEQGYAVLLNLTGDDYPALPASEEPWSTTTNRSIVGIRKETAPKFGSGIRYPYPGVRYFLVRKDRKTTVATPPSASIQNR